MDLSLNALRIVFAVSCPLAFTTRKFVLVVVSTATMAALAEDGVTPTGGVKSPADRDGDTVRVALRVRPMIGKEKVNRCTQCITIPSAKRPQVVMGDKRSFTYDYLYGPESTQADVYTGCIRPLVESAFAGYNATVLAYGQTGSGKTYTMGSGNNIGIPEEDQGVIVTVAREMFDTIKSIKQERPEVSVSIRVEFMEIYGEEMRDLLDPVGSNADQDGIALRTLDNGQIVVTGLKSENVASEADMLRCLERGSICRTTGSTLMNAHSSRSHAIFTVFLEQTIPGDITPTADTKNEASNLVVRVNPNPTEVRTSKFHFVDLAGSERAKKTGAVGQRLREGININVGLLALGNVISALGDPTKKGCHVPYRDSKLTRMLQDSLGGNSKTLMIACVSPADINFPETMSTLKYANRARNIKNKAVVNRDAHSAQIDSLMGQIQALKLALDEKGGTGAANAVLSQHNSSGHQAMDWRGRANDSDVELLRVMEELKETKRKLNMVNNEKVAVCAEREVLKQKLLDAGIPVPENLRKDSMFPKSLETQVLIDNLKTELAGVRAENKKLQHRAKLTSNLSSVASPSGGQWDRNTEEVLQRAKAHVEAEKTVVTSLVLEEELDGDDDETVEDGVDIDVQVHAEIDELETSFKDQNAQQQKSVQDITASIKMKEELIAELEETNQRYHVMREHFAQKIKSMDEQVKQTQSERDQLLKEIENMANSVTDAEKAAKEEMRKKFKEKENKLKEQQKQLASYRKFSAMKNNSERMAEEAKQELQRMKDQRAKILKKGEEEAKKHRAEIQRRRNEIMQLRKAASKNAQKISSLNEKNARHERQLKQRASQVAAAQRKLRQLQSQNQRLSRPGSSANTKRGGSSSSSTTTIQTIQTNMEKRATFLLGIEADHERMIAELEKRDHIMEEIDTVERERSALESQSEGGDQNQNLALLLENIEALYDQVEYQNARISEMGSAYEKKKARESTVKNFAEKIRGLPDARMHTQTLFDMYVFQKVELTKAKKDAAALKEKLFASSAEISESLTAKEVQRTEFQQKLNQIYREQQELIFSDGANPKLSTVGMADNEISVAKSEAFKQNKSLQNEVVQLRKLQQLQSSKLKDMNETNRSIRDEKEELNNRLGHMWRQVAEKDKKVTELSEHIKWLEFELQGRESASPTEGPSAPLKISSNTNPANETDKQPHESKFDNAPPAPSAATNMAMQVPREEKDSTMPQSNGMPTLDELEGELGTSKLSSPSVRRHKSSIWARLATSTTETQRVRVEATAKSRKETSTKDDGDEREKGWVGVKEKKGLDAKKKSAPVQKSSRRKSLPRRGESIYDRLSNKSNFTGVSKKMHTQHQDDSLKNGEDVDHEDDDGSAGDRSNEENWDSQQGARSPARDKIKKPAVSISSPSAEALTMAFIAAKDAASAAETFLANGGTPRRRRNTLM